MATMSDPHILLILDYFLGRALCSRRVGRVDHEQEVTVTNCILSMCMSGHYWLRDFRIQLTFARTLLNVLAAGDCLFNNLGRNGFKVTTVTDVDLVKCDKYKSSGASVVGSAREVAEASDVILSGSE